MKASEMIQRLQDLVTEVGDVEVLVTDGFDHHCYRANADYDYLILPFEYHGEKFIDIGVGGTNEDYHQDYPVSYSKDSHRDGWDQHDRDQEICQ